MKKPAIDFQLAPRRKPADLAPAAHALNRTASQDGSRNEEMHGNPAENGTLLPKLSEPERMERAASRAKEQQDTRRRLDSLKRAKDRAIRFFVNVPLDQATKERLVRAAHENDVKMTVIMQAAIDEYLRDNGY